MTEEARNPGSGLFGPKRTPRPPVPGGTFPIHLEPPAGPVLEGRGRNLTLRGLEVEVPEPVAVASTVGFRMQAWGGPFQGEVSVLRCTALGEDLYRLELEFAPGMSAVQAEQLARLLAVRPSRD